MILKEISEAKRAYETAVNKFNNAATMDEIDEAIYEMRAAEIRLNRLLRQAKEEGKTA